MPRFDDLAMAAALWLNGHGYRRRGRVRAIGERYGNTGRDQANRYERAD